ncbi:hypothetical protein HF086_013842, partial [Spodoptera exigua]
RSSNATGRGKRFTFQSTVRQLERRRLAEKLSKEADLKEQQRRTELEAMRRVEEEFQRKRAREKANIRQQLRLVSSGANSMPAHTTHHTKIRSVELSPWRTSGGARVYRDWSAAHAHPAACARMPIASQQLYNEGSGSAFSGSPVSDNYRREFARGRSSGSPLTPRAPRLLPAADRSTSGSDLSLRHPIKIRYVPTTLL